MMREAELRGEGSDSPTIAMFDLWHALCEETFGATLEVIVMNRRDHPMTEGFDRGQVNTAVPWMQEGKPVLLVLLEISDKGQFEQVILTHEIGHWVLKLQGFQAIVHRKAPHSNAEIMLNSLSQHPALYELQRSLGHDPQVEVDARAQHNLDLIKASDGGQLSRELKIQNALIWGDDLLNCSAEIAEELRGLILERFPKVSDLIDVILEQAGRYEMLQPDGNRK